MSRYANLLALGGIYLGILGLIIAAGSPGGSRQNGRALVGGLMAWLIGGLFVVGAYFEARRPDEARPRPRVEVVTSSATRREST